MERNESARWLVREFSEQPAYDRLFFMASARLRRAFRYPDSDNEEARQEMDEEEQERVISALQQENEQRNSQYTLIFTALPLISAVACLPLGFSLHSSYFQKLLCFFSVVSLLCTGYMMRYPPPQRLDAKVKRLPMEIQAKNRPIIKHIVRGNIALCAFLFISAYLVKEADQGSSSLWILCLVPGLVFLIATLLQKAMESVDPRELEALRYEYKGA